MAFSRTLPLGELNMGAWVLLLVLYTVQGNVTTAQINFTSENACENALLTYNGAAAAGEPLDKRPHVIPVCFHRD
jgi:hypothetical protein